jgi:hypothetical protein
MRLPPHINELIPSFNPDAAFDSITMSPADLRRIIAFALKEVPVDEQWYLSQYPDVRETADIRQSTAYAAEHYRSHGFLEGRLPSDPTVDEDWYRKTYPDVDEAIRQGKQTDARTHFIKTGYREGRKPGPDEKR